MKVTRLELENIKSFKGKHAIDLSPKINLLVGKNNTGKSTIINAIHNLQEGSRELIKTYNAGIGIAEIIISNFQNTPFFSRQSLNVQELIIYRGFCSVTFDSRGKKIINNDTRYEYNSLSIDNNRNHIYPFLSHRKVNTFSNKISKTEAERTYSDFTNLPAKVDRLDNVNAGHIYESYKNACTEIIGFPVSSTNSDDGKEPAYMVYGLDEIPIKEMGEGVINMLGLIVDLCVAENKLFLIEEPENDLHPQAQKALCNLILERAEYNQFIISTHSNIIVKSLGVDSDTKIFHLTSSFDKEVPKLMVSSINEIDNTDEEARIKVLEDLGYEFSDLGHWAAWLFLEESSAEVFIRDYFIRWFTPNLLGKVKTLAAKSLSRVNKRFDEFNEMFVYIHLSQIYKNKAWVVIDGGDGEEKKVIEELKEKYVKSNGWSEDRFRQLAKHNFEEYYPEQFQEEVKSVLGLSNKKEKWQAKKELLNTIKEWVKEDDNRAKVAFEKSAEEVIGLLKEIETTLN